MRFIPTKCLRPGQTMGADLVFDKNRVLLREGVRLTPKQIRKVAQLGFQGVYINDDISRDIHIENIISDELRLRAQSDIRSLFVTVESDIPQKSSAVLNLEPMIANIVDEILNNRNLMVNIVDIRAYDDYTYSHSINVAVLSTMLGTVLGLNKSMLNELAMGALVHDIGKVFIEKSIINKQSRLSRDEFEEVKRHSLAGYNYLTTNETIPEDAKTAVLSHHEQFAGTGYPTGLSGGGIPLYGRIIAVADVYDALVSDRPYRSALLPSDAVEYIMSGYNTMFDPLVVDSFIRKVAPYPTGTCVRLSSGIVGIVTENFESACMRPKIRVLEKGVATNTFVDLAHDYNALNMTIQEVLDI